MSRRTLAVIGAVSMLAGTAVAQPGGAARGRARGPDPERLKAELGVDDAQLETLRKLHMDQRKQAIRQRAEISVAELELNELLMAESVEETAVRAKVEQLSGLHAAALRARVDSRLALRGILSAEQARKLERLMRRPARTGAAERRPGRGGRGPQPQGGPRGGPMEAEPEPGWEPEPL